MSAWSLWSAPRASGEIARASEGPRNQNPRRKPSAVLTTAVARKCREVAPEARGLVFSLGTGDSEVIMGQVAALEDNWSPAASSPASPET